MKFSDLRLPSGTVLQLQFIDVSGERSSSKLLGFLEGETLLVTLPFKGGQALPVVKGQRVVARAITSSAAIAFQTVIEKVCHAPYAYLHLEYPTDVSVNRVRTSPRIATDLKAKVVNESEMPKGEEKAAQILDVSPTGARVQLAPESVKIGDDISLTSVFNFSDVDRSVVIKGVVRAKTGGQEGEQDPAKPVVYGVEFVDLSEEMTLFLHAYVYQRMLEGGS